MKTAIFIDDLFLKHDTGSYHPETPERLKVIQEYFEKKNLLNQFVLLPKRFAKKARLS
jgi:acetoin utilization deacetylase AcuC-like enzyme